jgi:hypothetical protein
MEAAIVRFNKTHCTALCPNGHLITAEKLDSNWGGSWLESQVAAHQAKRDNALDRLAAKCATLDKKNQ